jgi:hypothetical protein
MSKASESPDWGDVSRPWKQELDGYETQVPRPELDVKGMKVEIDGLEPERIRLDTVEQRLMPASELQGSESRQEFQGSPAPIYELPADGEGWEDELPLNGET